MPRERTKITKERPLPADAIGAPWRLFTGIAISPQFREPLEKLLSLCTATELPIRWIGANAAHLTLQFIGEVPVERAELLRMAFPRAGTGLHPFNLKGDGAGAFPSLRKPQVIWVGLKGDLNPLNRTHLATGQFLESFDIFEEEEREFRPHITIGRSRRALESPEINTLVALMRSDAAKEQLALLEEPMRVEAVHLFRTHLTKDGATYETVATARFGT